MKIPPAKIYFSEKDKSEILNRINESLTSGQLTLGKNTREFEESFAAYLNIKNTVAVNSGTSALEIPLRIFNVKDKEVLVPTNTFFATVLAVLHAGAKVCFVEADPATFSVDVNDLKNKIGSQTAGVIVVHIGGIVTPRINEIRELCEEHGIFLLEDAAHAHGSAYSGKKAGTFGHAASFSFYPTKLITSGEGGMIASSDEKIKNEAMLFRDQGKVSFTQNLHGKLGYNWRMSEIHAAAGLVHFRNLESFIEERANIARIYDKHLKGGNVITPLKIPEGCRTNYYKYIAMIDKNIDRQILKNHLRDKYDVGLSGEVYETPCHLQPVFKEQFKEGDFPLAEEICQRHICLPVYQGMKDEDAEYAAFSLKKAAEDIYGQKK